MGENPCPARGRTAAACFPQGPGWAVTEPNLPGGGQGAVLGLWASLRPEITYSQSQASQTLLNTEEELRTNGGPEVVLISWDQREERAGREGALGGSHTGKSPLSDLWLDRRKAFHAAL